MEDNNNNQIIADTAQEEDSDVGAVATRTAGARGKRTHWKIKNVWTVADDNVTYTHPIFRNENIQDLNFLKIIVANPPYAVPYGGRTTFWNDVILAAVRQTTECNDSYRAISTMSLDTLKTRYNQYISPELEKSLEKSGVNSGDPHIDALIEASVNGEFDKTERRSDDSLPVAVQIHRLLVNDLIDKKKKFDDNKSREAAQKSANDYRATREGDILMDIAIGADLDGEEDDEELFLNDSTTTRIHEGRGGRSQQENHQPTPSTNRRLVYTPNTGSGASSSTTSSSGGGGVALSMLENKRRKDEIKALKLKMKLERIALKRERAAAQDEQMRQQAEMNAQLQRGMIDMMSKILPSISNVMNPTTSSNNNDNNNGSNTNSF
jgi:hypothetical protein